VIPGRTYQPEDLLRIAWARRWTIAVPFFTILLATVLVIWKLPNTFQSETLILVVPQRVPESYVRATVTSRIEDRLQTISPQILNRPNLEHIIQTMDLYSTERQKMVMEDVVARMRKDIDVQVVRGDAFRITYVASKPDTAQHVVARLAALFIQENLRDREVQAQGTNEFLTRQLEDARSRLIENEKKVSRYEREHAAELPSQLNFTLQAAHNSEMQIQAVVETLNRDRDRRLGLERQLADEGAATRESQTTGDGDAAVPVAASALDAARAELAALESRFKPEHPDVQRQKRLVGELEAKLVAETPRSPAPAASPSDTRASRTEVLRRELEQVTEQIAAKEQEEQRLRLQVELYQQRVQAAPIRASELAELTRDHETLQEIYRNLLQKREDSGIAADLEQRQIGEQFKVLEPASLPERPFSPNRPRLAVLGALIALVFAVSLAALLEYFDTTLHSEEDVSLALGLRVLALVPLVDAAAPREQRRLIRFIAD
jgi:polysaccharide chain length determinant protein (PEP-CTERM system associated)